MRRALTEFIGAARAVADAALFVPTPGILNAQADLLRGGEGHFRQSPTVRDWPRDKPIPPAATVPTLRSRRQTSESALSVLRNESMSERGQRHCWKLRS